MKLALMQPYFFPYLGYFSLIKCVDLFIFFDTPQFIRHGWIERNRILKPHEGWQYIKVPLIKHSRDTSIKDIRIRNTENWQEKILAQVLHYKKKAPFYKKTVQIFEEIFAFKTDSIVELNINALKVVCGYLNIHFKYSVFSEKEFKLIKINSPDEWALESAKSLQAKSYYNLHGGIVFFDRKKFIKNNIDLHFLDIKITEYNQHRISFEKGLSIIDLMMFNSIKDINEMADNYLLK